ncbi:hypothetical protein ACFVYR_21045 [Streptomyces sp. NPDC058284]|uniref:hypothetical protein n=1 Tax=unclassified Streptomyces TaxID=2593676 RepID=UPI00365F3B92
MTSRSGSLPNAEDAPYFLFAHEPYFPPHGLREINTTIVEAAILLHSRVQQPDGDRMHRILNNGRRRTREIVPLATLTHELDGGAGWPAVGDWEQVTHDLLILSRFGTCDAIRLGLPAIERALMCTAPNSELLTFDAATGQRVTYGPTERASLLAQLQTRLDHPTAEHTYGTGPVASIWPDRPRP